MERRSNADDSNLPNSSPSQTNTACDDGTGLAAAACYNEDVPELPGCSRGTAMGNACDRDLSEAASTSSGMNSGTTNEHCCICLEEKQSPVFIRCGHSFCRSCLAKHRSYNMFKWGRRCPLCRYPLKPKHRTTRISGLISMHLARNGRLGDIIRLRHRGGGTTTRNVTDDAAAQTSLLGEELSTSGSTTSNMSLSTSTSSTASTIPTDDLESPVEIVIDDDENDIIDISNDTDDE